MSCKFSSKITQAKPHLTCAKPGFLDVGPSHEIIATRPRTSHRIALKLEATRTLANIGWQSTQNENRVIPDENAAPTL